MIEDFCRRHEGIVFMFLVVIWIMLSVALFASALHFVMLLKERNVELSSWWWWLVPLVKSIVGCVTAAMPFELTVEFVEHRIQRRK